MHIFCAIGPRSVKPSLGLFLFGFIFISGCTNTTRPLMRTPALYQTDTGGAALFAETPRERRTVELELLYITDRAPETDSQSDLPYGEERSRSLIFGTAVVKMTPNLTWADLEQQSRLRKRTKEVNLELSEVRERGRFPEEPYDLEVTSDGLIRSPTTVTQHRLVRARFESQLREQLRQSPSKEVVLYIHGFNESFASAAYTMADLCHYLGRQHVCMIFSWPASTSGNRLLSYPPKAQPTAYPIGHLRKAIRMIGQTPGVEGVHLLAHRRGAALLLNALQELAIETVAAGVEPAEALKLNHFVLMAPDIDEEVGEQQLETFSSDPDMISLWPYNRVPRMLRGRMTVYSSPEDRSLFVDRIPFRSSRSGQMTVKSQTEMGTWGKLDFIVYKEKRTHLFGHSDLLSDPAASSDLIQLLRYNKRPGAPGRPLKQIGALSWSFPGREASPMNQ